MRSPDEFRASPRSAAVNDPDSVTAPDEGTLPGYRLGPYETWYSTSRGYARERSIERP